MNNYPHHGVDEEDNYADGVDGHDDAHGARALGCWHNMAGTAHRGAHSGYRTRLKSNSNIQETII